MAKALPFIQGGTDPPALDTTPSWAPGSFADDFSANPQSLVQVSMAREFRATWIQCVLQVFGYSLSRSLWCMSDPDEEWLQVVYQFFGHLHSVSHAQLSLIGQVVFLSHCSCVYIYIYMWCVYIFLQFLYSISGANHRCRLFYSTITKCQFLRVASQII